MSSLQQRFEESSLGQTVLTVLFVVLIVAVVTWNLPDSKVSEEVGHNWGRPMVQALGLDQAWGVFSPNPRSESIDLRAEVTLADGRQVEWRPPAQGYLVEPYRSYRWWKWVENVHVDSAQGYWYQTALWVAQRYKHESPTQVTLVRRWRESTPPGTNNVDHWHSYAFYTLQVGGGSS